jgi:hypothetical protein
MAGSVTVRDLGWNKIKANARRLDGKGVKVGILARDAGKLNDGVRVVDYAVWNEFGTERAPKRPFMRHTADTGKVEIGTVAVRWAQPLLIGKIGVDQVLHGLGRWYAIRTKATIRNSRAWATPNAPSTVARKGSNIPLIETGFMLATIDYELDK